MSSTPVTATTPYDPVPRHEADSPAPGLHESFANQQGAMMSETNSMDIPSGAAQPRFIGTALYDDPSGPHVRDSYVSSGSPSLRDQSVNDSVYALNDGTLDSRRPLADTLYSGGYRDDPEQFDDQPGVAMSPMNSDRSRYMEEKRATYAAPRAKSKRIMIMAAVAAVILLILAIVIPVYFAVVKPKNNKNNLANNGSGDDSSSDSDGTSSSGGGKNAIVTGGDGSEITMEGGDKFTYSNKFGGTWYWDDEDPFNNNAQAQTYTPPLNESFKYGEDKIFGVNIGGWLVPEPFIVPSLYEPYVNNTTPAVDEWTLCENMRNSDGGIDLLEEHYKTFITEKDFAEIAGAGLNHVRIPIGYYAIETRGDEPFLAKTSWKYFLKAINWARKYGLRINLDLHVLPGSQNGWNHSGRLGDINMLLGPMGLANAQRSLDYIRIIAEFISQDQYKDVVTIFGVTNEPRGPFIGQDQLKSYYYQAYQIVREASGTGEGKGPYISLHDGFMGLPQWEGFMEGADRVQLDWHPYIAFNDQSDAPMSSYAGRPCDTWGKPINQSMSAFGITAAGEFSNGVTDCGWWLNGVEDGVRYEGTYKEGNFPRVGSCDDWINYDTWDDDMKASVKQFAMESMDAMQNWFFWTWKIGESKTLGKVGSPAWSYSLGLDQGWMPTDPRTAYGSCGNPAPWDGELKAWQTGGSGAGSLASTVAWPPSTISNGGAPDELPTYTPTGSLVTLPGPTFTSAPSVKVGSGWNNGDDQTPMMTDAAGCSYLDPWVGTNAAPPSPLCTS